MPRAYTATQAAADAIDRDLHLRMSRAERMMFAVLQQIEREMRAGFGSSFGETREQVRRAIAAAAGDRAVTSTTRREDFEDAAEDLAAAAGYLKTALDNGEEIYESKWLGAVMEAHGLLLAAAESAPTD